MKIDHKKTVASYRAKPNQFSVIEVPTMQYLMIDGHEGPGSADFTAAIEALYPVAHKLKFMSKLSLEKDYVVPPFEALWWAQDMDVFTTKFDQSRWDWTAMIMAPDWITEVMFQTALEEVSAKKNLKSLLNLRLAKLIEGTCVQIMHLGSYSDEGPILETMHQQFIPENGFEMQGKHHEIYFNDFRKVTPEKLRTILRQPVVVT